MATITKFMGNKRVAFGTQENVGTSAVTVATGLESVDMVIASSAGGSAVAVDAQPSATAGSIELVAASTTDVAYIAIGE